MCIHPGREDWGRCVFYQQVLMHSLCDMSKCMWTPWVVIRDTRLFCCWSASSCPSPAFRSTLSLFPLSSSACALVHSLNKLLAPEAPELGEFPPVQSKWWDCLVWTLCWSAFWVWSSALFIKGHTRLLVCVLPLLWTIFYFMNNIVNIYPFSISVW